MRAVVCTKYRSLDGLKLVDLDKPTPKDNELLVRIRATSVTTGDWRVQSLTLPPGFGLIARLAFGFSSPKQPIFGTELSGDIESVGKDVKNFKAGDKVIAMTGAKFGCHAEYRCIPESGAIVLKPDSLAYEEGAVLAFGGLTALDFLKERAKIQAGEKVLVQGASGAVGIAAVQLAKYFGAEVTGVCSTSNLEFVKSMGADRVVDYTKEDFTKSGNVYDIIFDAAGNLTYSQCKDSLTKNGRIVLSAAGLSEMLKAPVITMMGSKRVLVGPASESPELLRALVDLAAQGKFKAVIDRTFPLEGIKDAYTYIGQRRKRGNIAITV